MRRLLLILLALPVAFGAPAAPSPGPAALSDPEVVSLLRGGELIEWSRARKMLDDGIARAAAGQSIAETPRVPIKGSGGESPEAARQRGLAVQKEGEELIVRANFTLTRLRSVAAARLAEQTKTISAAAELVSSPWHDGSLLAAIRGTKAARDAGALRLSLIHI